MIAHRSPDSRQHLQKAWAFPVAARQNQRKPSHISTILFAIVTTNADELANIVFRRLDRLHLHCVPTPTGFCHHEQHLGKNQQVIRHQCATQAKPALGATGPPSVYVNLSARIRRLPQTCRVCPSRPPPRGGWPAAKPSRHKQRL